MAEDREQVQSHIYPGNDWDDELLTYIEGIITQRDGSLERLVKAR
jgi:hypothetical protein